MIRQILVACAATAAISALFEAKAETQALTLLRMCEGRESEPSNPSLDVGMCAMYLAGLTDAHGAIVGLQKVPPVFCFPEKGVQLEQTIRVFVAYAKSHPESLHVSARIFALIALREAFPCKHD